MTPQALTAFYQGYLACLNAQDWPHLGDFVAEDASHNGRPFGLTGYRDMLVGDFRAIPDLRFVPVQILAQPPDIAARLRFDCHPAGTLFGLPVNGRRVVFDEHVFYRLRDGRIAEVWSLIDAAAIAAQIAGAALPS